jgi:cytoskeleton protein RodZ
MTEASDTAAAPAPTAGRLLREARQAQGLHIAVLATALKVPPHKLELLESDRLDELPGITFSRALAQAVCRHLRIDAEPVLRLLPQAGTGQGGLEQVTRGLATPFRDHAMPRGLGMAGTSAERPVWLSLRVLAPMALLLLAAAVLWWPAELLPRWPLGDATAPATAASAGPAALPASEATAAAASAPVTLMLDTRLDVASAAAPVAAAVVETVHSAPAVETPASGDPAGALWLRTSAESWVEVRDRADKVVFSRMMTPGETVGVDGAVPLRIKIGNADGTRLRFRGQPVDLAPVTRNNVATLELP